MCVVSPSVQFVCTLYYSSLALSLYLCTNPTQEPSWVVCAQGFSSSSLYLQATFVVMTQTLFAHCRKRLVLPAEQHSQPEWLLLSFNGLGTRQLRLVCDSCCYARWKSRQFPELLTSRCELRGSSNGPPWCVGDWPERNVPSFRTKYFTARAINKQRALVVHPITRASCCGLLE